jgi:protein SCO1/2
MKRGILAVVALVAMAACREPSGVTTTTAAEPVTAQGPSAPIYPLHLALRDEHDAAVGLDLFRGHPVIVSMFYGSCPAACPLIVAHVKQIEAQLPPEVRAKTRVLLVSFDAEHDTPAALRAIAERHHADEARWTFATGPDDEVRQLANVLGVVYRKEQGGAFSHNSVISVLDAEGRIVAKNDESGADLAPLARAVTAAASPQPR